MQARHTYGDWTISPTNVVGIILNDLSGQRSMIRWQDGSIKTVSIFDYTLITEYEYYKVVNPSRCGKSIEELIADMRANLQEDYFTGGLCVTSIMKPKKEDYF